MTRADRLLIVSIAALALAAWPLVAMGAGAGDRVTITGPAGVSSFPLADERTLTVQGRVGEVSVVIDRGEVSVRDADCPDLICVKTGAVSAGSSVIACVPNGVVVRIDRSGDDEFDARIR